MPPDPELENINPNRTKATWFLSALVMTIAFIAAHLAIMFLLTSGHSAVDRLLESFKSLISAPVVIIAAWLGIASWQRSRSTSDATVNRTRVWPFVLAAFVMAMSVPIGLIIFSISDWIVSHFFDMGLAGSWFKVWLPLNIISIGFIYVFWRDIRRSILSGWVRSTLLLIILTCLGAVDAVAFLAQ